MEQKLYGAALFFNPHKLFAIKKTNRRLATQLHSVFNNVLWKMATDDELQIQISKLADDYEQTEGECFMKQMAMKGREKRSHRKHIYVVAYLFLLYVSTYTC
jgi:hypothetical protein